MKYRPEIDGLRAIAVLSVIFYHAKIVFLGRDWFTGGYIGVDIFFVISGYLITKIILAELFEAGTFNFRNFYERRARRILPILLAVMLVSTPFAWFLLMPEDFAEYSKSILSAIFFVSNFFFYFATTEYGAESSLLKPFLHTWSLGIEEQFYIIFPILLIICFSLFRKYIFMLLVAMLVLSLTFSGLMERYDDDLNFYLPMSRFWELLAGSILAYLELRYGRIKNQMASYMLPFIGLGLIVYSVIFFTNETPHPSFMTLIPIIGVFFIIAFSSAKDPVGKILSFKPFVGIGLISYSAYLWHFPILAFSRWATLDDSRSGSSDLTDIEKLGLILTTLLLSVLSYYLIEKPLRRNASLGLFLKLMLPCLLILVSFNAFALITNGYSDRIPRALAKEEFDDRVAYREDFLKCHKTKELDFCKFGPHSKDAYLVGDSHMISLAFNLKAKLDQKGYNLTIMTRPGAFYGRSDNVDRARNEVLRQVKDSVVIFGGYAHREDRAFFKEHRNQYKKLFETLTRNNNDIILVYPIPSVNLQYSMSLVNEYNNSEKLEDRKAKLDDFLRDSVLAYEFLDTFKGGNIHRIHPADFSCDASYCYAVKDNIIYISDYDHPSSFFANKINQAIISHISK